MGENNVTFDSGVAELGHRIDGNDSLTPCAHVELLRVGTLKDIMVLNYLNMNVVLMVVSWVAPNTELVATDATRLTWVLACKHGCNATFQQRSIHTSFAGNVGTHPWSLHRMPHTCVNRGDPEHAVC